MKKMVNIEQKIKNQKQLFFVHNKTKNLDVLRKCRYCAKPKIIIFV